MTSWHPFRWMCFWAQTNTRVFSSPRCRTPYCLHSIATPYYLHGIIIINLYDDSAISCLASTLPNHDGQLAGLGTTSAPAGSFILAPPLPCNLSALSHKIFKGILSTSYFIIWCDIINMSNININTTILRVKHLNIFLLLKNIFPEVGWINP